MTKKRIALVAPPFSQTPPQGQGGTERIVYQMVEGFSQRGYPVTLFGCGKCQTSARFVQIFKEPISQKKFETSCQESSRALRIESAYLGRVMAEIVKQQKEFDLVFNHLRAGYLFLPLAQYLKIPIVSILHLPIFQELADYLALFKKPNIITISNSQRRGFPQINYLANVYNGVDLKEFSFQAKPRDYFLFMGALGEHKNPAEAILAAKKAGVKLIIAGGKKREPYFSQKITPLLDGQQIKYLGEVSGKKRLELFQGARGFLFPIKWPEPFGLVMIEAMACGTPVIAYPNGAVAEIIKDKQTGFIVKNTTEMAKAINRIDEINRRQCRQLVEQKFSMETMLDKYEKICHNLLNNKTP